MKDYTPREYQNHLIEFGLEHSRCAWWSGMGTGKTSATYALIDLLRLMGDVGRTLVIAPKRVALTTWVDEQAKWRQFQDIGAPVPIIGTAAERKAALRQDANVYTINMENIPWLMDQINKWPWDMVVFDEATRLAGMRSRGGTIRSRHLRRIAATAVKRWINLTGTPAPNGYLGLWGQTYPLDFGERLGKTYSAYQDKWFKQHPYSKFRMELAHDACRQEIEDKLRDICITIMAEDWFDLDEPVFVENRVVLPPKARAQYQELEKTFALQLVNGYDVEAISRGVLLAKLSQLAAGAIYASEDNKEWSHVHDAKLEALESIRQEANGESLLVAYYYKHDLVRLQKAFPKARVLDSGPDVVRAWNAGEIDILLAHPQSAGHGLNLQDGGRRIVFFSFPNYNLEYYQQIIERLGPVRQTQAGHPRTVFVHNIIADDTTDDIQVSALQGKGAAQNLLLNAMKRKYHL